MNANDYADLRFPSSYRDPSGFVFKKKSDYFRYITPKYFTQYDRLMTSGLYQALVDEQLLIPHEEIHRDDEKIIIRPLQIEFFTYPNEWSFEQLKDGALLTLNIQRRALEYGMILKDASSYNVTFYQNKPLFIDTLSFEIYQPGDLWLGLDQFITFFLAPIVMSKYLSEDVIQSLAYYINGIPVTLASDLLPWKTKFSPFIYSYIHLTSKLQKRHQNSKDKKISMISKNKLIDIISHIEHNLNKSYSNKQTEWSDYYNNTNYNEESFQLKEKILLEWIQETEPKKVLDIGANNGHFDRVISNYVDFIISTDVDSHAVNHNYCVNKTKQLSNIASLVIDYLNPTPSVGFDNKERLSFFDRIKSLEIDLVVCLAFIHHMSITRGVPFDMIARQLSKLSMYLIIEFPEINDSKVKQLLDNKRSFREYFSFYNLANFSDVFGQYFETIKKFKIQNTERTLFLMKSKDV